MPNATQTAPVTNPDELDTRLATVQQLVSALDNPIPLVEDIEAELENLDDEGADPEALTAISHNAISLLDIQRQQAAAFVGVMDIAQQFRQQRETVRARLSQLQEAIATCDVEVPEIEALAETIRDEQEEMFWNVMDDMFADQIVSSLYLTYSEANKLVGLLTEGELDSDHFLVDELKDWIRRADEYLRTGLTPPPDISD